MFKKDRNKVVSEGFNDVTVTEGWKCERDRSTFSETWKDESACEGSYVPERWKANEKRFDQECTYTHVGRCSRRMEILVHAKGLPCLRIQEA